MLIAARNAMLMGGTGPWQNPYVTDGLVAMWDGEWNAGGGVHDPYATAWRDLVGSCDLTRRGTPTVGAQFVGFDGTSCFYGTSQFGAICTMDVVADAKTQVGSADPELVRLDGTWQYKYHVNSGQLSAGISMVNGIAGRFGYVNTGIKCATWIFEKNPQLTYLNGNYNSSWAQNRPQTATGVVIGAGANWIYRPGVGDVYNVRLYSRALTAAEIAANYAVDKIRFGLP